MIDAVGTSAAAIRGILRKCFSNLFKKSRADSTAQFLDWFKTPMPSWGIFEYYRGRAEELEERRQAATRQNRVRPRFHGVAGRAGEAEESRLNAHVDVHLPDIAASYPLVIRVGP